MILLEIQDFDYSYWQKIQSVFYRNIYCSEKLLVQKSCFVISEEYLFYYIVPEFSLLPHLWKKSDIDYSMVSTMKSKYEHKIIGLNYINIQNIPRKHVTEKVIKISILVKKNLKENYDLLLKIKQLTDQHYHLFISQIKILKNLPWSIKNVITIQNKIDLSVIELESKIDDFNIFL